jgi:hypothetical protein
MQSKTPRKLETQSECSTEEFARFDHLLREVLRVPKEEIKKQEEKTAKSASRKKRP